MVCSLKISHKRLAIVPNGTNVFSISARYPSDHFADVTFATFTTRNAVNDVEGGACKIVPNNTVSKLKDFIIRNFGQRWFQSVPT